MIRKGDTLRFADNEINRIELPYLIGITAYCRDISGEIVHVTCTLEPRATILSFHRSRFEKIYSRPAASQDFCLNCHKLVEPIFVPTATPPGEQQEGFIACPDCLSDDSLTDDFAVVAYLCTELSEKLAVIQKAREQRKQKSQAEKDNNVS